MSRQEAPNALLFNKLQCLLAQLVFDLAKMHIPAVPVRQLQQFHLQLPQSRELILRNLGLNGLDVFGARCCTHNGFEQDADKVVDLVKVFEDSAGGVPQAKERLESGHVDDGPLQDERLENLVEVGFGLKG